MLAADFCESQVAYIDTEGTFRPERIKPIAERFELDADAVLDNVRPILFLSFTASLKRRTEDMNPSTEQHQHIVILLLLSIEVAWVGFGAAKLLTAYT